MPRRRSPSQAAAVRPESYQHTEANLPLRPEVGTQPLFKKRKEPATYRYDSSLSPALDWDTNPARELGEWLLGCIEEASRLPAPHQFPRPREFRRANGQIAARVTGLQDAVAALKALSRPFLNWTGKAERLSFDVPTLPLFVHERLSTRAILETLKAHKRDKQDDFLEALFGNPSLPLTDQVLRAYEHREGWTNRLVLGDSLVVMNSLLRFENLGGQVQMIYMDPPYGVKFGSNFQPFVRKRDVKHNDDADLTREPEMVQAYRDTWELGLHSYLTYLRDRLLLAKELLAPTGSIFVQISDENLHHVREVMDEIFGPENLVGIITLKKTHHQESELIPCVADYLVWYCRDKERIKYRQYLRLRKLEDVDFDKYRKAEMPDGTVREITEEERNNPGLIPVGHRPFRDDITMTQDGESSEGQVAFEVGGKTFYPGVGRHWRTGADGRKRLRELNRVVPGKDRPFFKAYWDDTPLSPINNIWSDLSGTQNKLYVVQTNEKAIERCLLMTTDPGDLVLDPTCGSGTTAYVAEQWGRRWITIDTSRVPLALARQRLLTATFDYYELKDENRGPAGGFVYKRRQNAKGEEVGGIVPHITLKSIANNEPPQEEILVDRPEIVKGIVRVCGPFTVEATIPTAMPLEEFQGSSFGFQEGQAGASPETGNSKLETAREEFAGFISRMIEILRRNPVLRLGGNRSVTLRQVRPPARTLSLHAEALQEFQVSSVEFQDGGSHGAQVSGTDRMAEGHGVGGGDLPADQSVSQGGSVRVDQPNASSGGVRAEQRGGGAGTIESRGVSAVSGTGAGIVAGVGDASGTGKTTGLSDGGRVSGVAGTQSGSAAASQRANLETGNLKLETGNSKLETRPVAIVFGPEHGAVSGKLVENAAIEARRKDYSHLYVIGFAIEAGARKTVEESEAAFGIPATYVQATPDILMGDLLKTMRSSQISASAACRR